MSEVPLYPTFRLIEASRAPVGAESLQGTGAAGGGRAREGHVGPLQQSETRGRHLQPDADHPTGVPRSSSP